MLTISRKHGQSVVVQVPGHPPLTISLVGSRTGRCQLAFDGPHDYHILREELVEANESRTEASCLPAKPTCRTSREDANRLPTAPR